MKYINKILVIKYLTLSIVLFFSTLAFSKSIDLQCLKTKIETKVLIEDTQFDGIYDFEIKIKSKKNIKLINSNTEDKHYISIFNQIQKTIKDSFSKCNIPKNILVKIRIDTSEDGVEVFLELIQ
jgi:hypothetical protein